MKSHCTQSTRAIFLACSLGAIALPALAQDSDGDGHPDSSDNCPLIANPSQADCDGDGNGDACAIATGAPDCNANSIPDSCELCEGNGDAYGDGYLDSCECRQGNLNLDENIDGADLGILLSHWGVVGSTIGDIDGNGVVNGGDLGSLLGGWGPVQYNGIPTPTWATVLAWCPDPGVVTNSTLRAAISATGLPWRVRDTATQIEMLLVPPGSFMMGCSPSNWYACNTSEDPVHLVTLTNAFYIGRYEVTQSQWQARMGWNPSSFQGHIDSPSRPVEQVSWYTIQTFNTVTGIRLPTEAEWEHAYRAGTTTAFHSMPGYPSGTNDDNLLENIAWFAYVGGVQTHAVGGKAANALGIHDMAGNVHELCQDWFGNYPTASQTNPTGPMSGDSRVLRGGSLNSSSSSCRASAHSGYLPVNAYYNVGFRVARNP